MMMKLGFRVWTLVVKMAKFNLVLLVKFEVESLFLSILCNCHVQTQLQFVDDSLLSCYPEYSLALELSTCTCKKGSAECVVTHTKQENFLLQHDQLV